MIKSLFYMVSGYLRQALLYMSCKVDVSQVPVCLMVILWVLRFLMTYLFFETVLKNGIMYRAENF